MGVAANCKVIQQKEISVCPDGTKILGSCEYFVVKEIKLMGEESFVADETSYHALIVTEGELNISGANFDIKMRAGETVFVPASLGEYVLKGSATVLLTTNPLYNSI